MYAVDTEQGVVHLQIKGDYLCRVWCPGQPVPAETEAGTVDEALPPSAAETGWLAELIADLRAYLAGQPVELACWRSRFKLEHVTPFRQRVYEALLEVGRGQTCTYGELASRVGRPKAARAVGSAMANNPLPLFIPCHRVLSVHGLGGYGGGLQLKRRLLAMEGALPVTGEPESPNG